MARTIRELVMAYFVNHPNRELADGPVVDWVTEQYVQEQGKPPGSCGELSGNSIKRGS